MKSSNLIAARRPGWIFDLGLQPHLVFLILGGLFGLIWLVVTPPFQAPDENMHFFRSYQISEGQFFPEKVQGLTGGYLAKSLVETIEQVNPGLKFHSKDQRQDLDKLKYYLKLPLNPGDRVFHSFPASAVYPPTGYLPQVGGIVIARWFGGSPLWLMYAGRLCDLIFYLVVIGLALKLLPGGRWLMTAIALLPMNIFLAGSLNQDGVINALVYFLIAYLLHLAQRPGPLTFRQYALVFVLVFLASFSKPVFAILSLLFFLLPRRKFLKTEQYYLAFAVLFTAGYAVSLLWNTAVVTDLNWYKPWSNFEEQVALVKANPLIFISAALRSLWTFKGFYIKSFIGTLGWLDTVLPFTTVILPFLLILMVLAVFEGHLKLTIANRLIMAMVALAILGQSLLSQYLVASPVAAPYVHGFQGRYMLAAAPLALFICQQRRWQMKEKGERIVFALVSAIMLLSLIQSTLVLWGRYYG